MNRYCEKLEKSSQKIYDSKSEMRDQTSSNLVGNCLKWYSLEDKVNALKHKAHICDEDKFKDVPFVLKSNNRTAGCYNKVREILHADDMTSYQHLVKDLKETTYNSYWNKRLGQSRDKLPLLPCGMDIYNTTFGFPYEHIDLGDIVNPRKSYMQVMDEATAKHEDYIKSHNSYWPGEQIRRNYECPFSLNTTFGMKSNTDKHGKLIPRILRWSNNGNLSIVDEKQARNRSEKLPQLGKAHCSIEIDSDPAETRVVPDPCDVSDLLKECDPNMTVKNVYYWLSHINKVRNNIKRKRNFNFSEFYNVLKYYDQNKNGWVEKDIIYKVCYDFHISFNKEILDHFLIYLEILKDDKLDIFRFANILNINREFPDLPVRNDVPERYQYYETSTEASFEKDRLIVDNSNLPSAGVSLEQKNSRIPRVSLQKSSKADIEQLGGETTVKCVVNPSLQTMYGLSHRDYFVYRPKTQLKEIFQKVTGMSDEHFEFLWKEAEKIDNGCVNVQIIRDLIKKYAKI